MSRRRWPDSRDALFLLLLGAPACARPAVSATSDRAVESIGAAATTALAADSALIVIASRPLWPGFAPLSTPVAIFDGSRTWLFRHPSPPAGYVALQGRPDVATRVGRDTVVTANTSALLGGASTATVMLDPRLSAPEAAALTIHELFHVFQRARHPNWQANEADLFTYPVEAVLALAWRREETDALARALAASTTDTLRCWVRAFSDARQRRLAALGVTAAAYERGTELNEGLAQYVERRAVSRPILVSATDWPAAQMRQRSYAVGAAIGALLDRTRPQWREHLESAGATTPPLDVMLAEAVGSRPESLGCAPTEAKRAEWRAKATVDVRAVIAERTQVRDEYLARAGWRLVIEAGDAPFFPQGFDPLNVTRVSTTEILHTRFLKLQGALGSLQVLSGSVLTEGPGAHPLFNGVRRVIIADVAPLSVRDSAGVLAVDAGAITARLRGVHADTTGQVIRLTRQ